MAKKSTLEKTSETIIIGARIVQPAANAFFQERIDLQLNPLDNEVFVVQAVDIMLGRPDAVASTDTLMIGSVTSTSQTDIPTLAESPVFAIKQLEISSANATSAVSFSTGSSETPPTQLDYVGILATNDFFLQIDGFNNTAAHTMDVKLYGYRAQASPAVYAALVQSEVLSGR